MSRESLVTNSPLRKFKLFVLNLITFSLISFTIGDSGVKRVFCLRRAWAVASFHLILTTMVCVFARLLCAVVIYRLVVVINYVTIFAVVVVGCCTNN